MPYGELGEAEAANREAWEILRRRAETLQEWAEHPPETLDEDDRPIVRMLARLSLHALWSPPGSADGGGALGRLRRSEDE
jgi:hypothetical protein